MVLLWVSTVIRPDPPGPSRPGFFLSDGAPPVTDFPTYDPELADAVVTHGREGLGRAEIASELGVPLSTLTAWSADHPDFAAALERADSEARAWWDAQPRLALNEAKIFKAGAWRQAMIQRYGSGAPPKTHEPEPEKPAEPEVHFYYPDNGRG